MNALAAGLFVAALAAWAQDAPKPAPSGISAQPSREDQELFQTVSSANNISVDLVRVLEAFLKKYPQTAHRPEIERLLAKAAIDTQDDRRTVLYGEKSLATSPHDVLVIDRVAHSLLALGGRENAQRALQYAQRFEQMIEQEPAPAHDVARRQDERDHALGRTLLYQSNAMSVLGNAQLAEQLAARSFAAYPASEPARVWAEALLRRGRDEEAVTHFADAFALSDAHVADAGRAADRRRLGETYRKIHGSENGLGDAILSAYDRNAALLEGRRNRLRGLDPNFGETEAMQFALTSLDGAKLELATLKGKVVVVDFWATWCVPCRTQHPMYETLKERFKDSADLVFLSIDTDENRQLVAPFLAEQGWSRSVYFEDGLERLLQVTSIPTTLVFSRNGRVASRMNGFVPDNFVDQLTERIRSALDEPNP